MFWNCLATEGLGEYEHGQSLFSHLPEITDEFRMAQRSFSASLTGLLKNVILGVPMTSSRETNSLTGHSAWFSGSQRFLDCHCLVWRNQRKCHDQKSPAHGKYCQDPGRSHPPN